MSHFAYPILSHSSAKSEVCCLDFSVLSEESHVKVCGQTLTLEKSKEALMGGGRNHGPGTFLLHGVGFAAPAGPFGDSEAEMCPVCARMVALVPPAKPELYFRQKQPTAGQPSLCSHMLPASVPASKRLGAGLATSLPLCPEGYQFPCSTNHNGTRH